ncbi:hypothetical protein LCGC14_2437240 [marine sediment metagenome]|uniref:Uncharacterized protein n=1 Tax=marine sediment metagenome TaxID=412755 RepID=A0A0F9C7I2_9ZZZZ
MHNVFKKKYERKLNGKTPLWFKEWYAGEFVPYKVKIDMLLILGSGIFIGVIVNLIS